MQFAFGLGEKKEATKGFRRSLPQGAWMEKDKRAKKAEFIKNTSFMVQKGGNGWGIARKAIKSHLNLPIIVQNERNLDGLR
jgi:hypothetical protein